MSFSQSSSQRLTSLAIAAVAGTILIAGCSTSSPNPRMAAPEEAGNELQPVTLMLNWTPNAHHAGIYYAHENGFYENAGIDLNIIEPGDGVDAAAAVAQGQVEFGISQAESLLPARAAGMDIQAIATILPVNDTVLMGLQDSGLSADPASLSGLTYGGYGGALETEIMSELTSCSGGNPEDIEFIEIGNVDYLTGLEQGRFDVTWVFGGWDALRAQSERDDVITIPLSDHNECIPNWYTPVIVGNGDSMAQDPDLAHAFLEATGEGYEAVAEDSNAGADALLQAAPELDPELVHSAVSYYAPLFTSQGGFGAMEEQVWQRFTAFLVQAGMLDDASPLEGAWTNEYLADN